ncbi:MAG: alanine dehydrogenase [Clostridium sp.]|nr:alanine dehydrogenase [Clostridium sp.]
MIIGVPKEIKNGENRVSLIPSSVKTLIENDNIVYIEKGAGEKIGFDDEQYKAAGAKILDTAAEVYSKSEIIVKVKEIQKEEYELLKNGQTVFTYLHLAVDQPLLDVLLKKKITAIAYETIQMPDGTLPLLRPMSEICGKMSIQIGARLLENKYGGYGKLIGGVPGVHPAKVLIVGAGVVGLNAAKIAVGMGANVVMLDTCPLKLDNADKIFNGRVNTAISNKYNLEKYIKNADLVIGAVLIPAIKAPSIITEDMVKMMKKGSSIIDVSINQGGITETISEPTTIDEPIFEKHGVVHYAVPNIPSMVGRTATISLNNYTLPYILKLSTKGFIAAVKSTPELYKGINTYQGKLTNSDIAKSAGYPYSELSMLIGF